MKIKLNEQQAAQVEAGAVQTVIQKVIAARIEERAAEIVAELEGIDGEMTPEEIQKKYIRPQLAYDLRREQAVQTPAKAILVPAK